MRTLRNLSVASVPGPTSTARLAVNATFVGSVDIQYVHREKVTDEFVNKCDQDF